MKKLKSRALQPGAKIGIAAPAGPVDSIAKIEESIRLLEKLGYRVILGESVRPSQGYLAGSDLERRADLEKFWGDGSVEAIWCLRGGYGSVRLLPDLYLGLIKKNPKILIGFSDITGLELGLWTQIRLVTFHGPVLTTLQENFSIDYAIRMLSNQPEFGWPDGMSSNYTVFQPGRVRGILLGGNLSLVSSLLGTKYFPDLDGAILFLEETGEPAYRIDRMLTQILLSGALDPVAGVMVGRCNPVAGETEADLVRVFEERFSKLRRPAAYGFPIGHIPEQWTLPQGVAAEVEMEKGDLNLLESPLGSELAFPS